MGDIAGKGLSPGKNNKVKVLRSKARTKLVESETGRMQAVLSHPQFQANPIAAISNHIVAALKNNAQSGAAKSAPRVVGGKAGKAGKAGGGAGGGAEGGAVGAAGGVSKKKGGGKVVDVKDESDEVALATQRRGAEASRRGIKFAGDGAPNGGGGGGKRGVGAGRGLHRPFTHPTTVRYNAST